MPTGSSSHLDANVCQVMYVCMYVCTCSGSMSLSEIDRLCEYAYDICSGDPEMLMMLTEPHVQLAAPRPQHLNSIVDTYLSYPDNPAALQP